MNHLSYSETYGVLRTAHRSNVSLLKESLQQLVMFEKKVSDIINLFSEYQANQTPTLLTKTISQSTFDPSDGECPYPKYLIEAWNKIYTDFNNSHYFDDIRKLVGEMLIPRLRSLCERYDKENLELEKKVDEMITKLNNEQNDFDDADCKYQCLCNNIESMHAKMVANPTNGSIRDEFNENKFKYKSNQENAIKKLEKLNENLGIYEYEMEKYLSNFEKYDKERETELSSIFDEFANEMMNVSRQKKENLEKLKENIDSIHSREDVDAIFDKPDEYNEIDEDCVINFEVPTFKFQVNEFLDPKEVFSDEIHEFECILTENYLKYKKGDIFTVIFVADNSVTVVSDSGITLQIPSEIIQPRNYDRKIYTVSQPVDSNELQVNVGEPVLVLNVDGKCMSIYGIEGYISMEKLTEL